jgi:hypothetical protein
VLLLLLLLPVPTIEDVAVVVPARLVALARRTAASVAVASVAIGRVAIGRVVIRGAVARHRRASVGGD